METTISIDTEFMHYWAQLTPNEKMSLLSVAKNYVHLKKDTEVTEDVHKKIVQEERSAYLNGEGKTYSWEQVKEMAIHKDKRHAL